MRKIVAGEGDELLEPGVVDVIKKLGSSLLPDCWFGGLFDVLFRLATWWFFCEIFFFLRFCCLEGLGRTWWIEWERRMEGTEWTCCDTTPLYKIWVYERNVNVSRRGGTFVDGRLASFKVFTLYASPYYVYEPDISFVMLRCMSVEVCNF